MFGFENEIKKDCRKLNINEFYDLYSSSNTVK